jgi:hypothetical protein
VASLVRGIPWAWAFGLPVLIYWALYFLPPASWWLTVGRVTAFDAPAGASVVMEVDRTIRRPFTAEWRVLVRRYTGAGWEVVCTANGGGDYRPDAVLPSPLTLNWWTNGQCSTPAPGQIMVSTVWRIQTGLPGVRTVVAESNVFRITDAE